MRRRISCATACLTLAAVAVADEPAVVYNDLDVSAGGAWAEPVMLHRDTYAAWLAEPDYDTWTKYTDGTSVIACRPKIVRLTWGEAGRSLVFTNLVPGATYPWSVTKSDGTTLGGSFTTASAAPRWLSSPIIGWTEGGKETYTMNFRDLGGWELAGGAGKRTCSHARALAASPTSLDALDGLIRSLKRVGSKTSLAQAYQRYRDSLTTKQRK